MRPALPDAPRCVNARRSGRARDGAPRSARKARRLRLFNPAAPCYLPAVIRWGGMGRPFCTRGRTMAIERTLSIIKPDATARNLTGRINAKFEEAGLRIVAQKRLHLTREQAGEFYAVHRERPFYEELCAFMASGPVVVQVLEGEGAIAKNREVMGATNPADAVPGTIRAEFAKSVGENSVHGSDAAETAAAEIAFFFAGIEIVG
jgi:nucleoside-diphosphate kinase